MPSLLIVTRHTPLPWEDGAGAYLHDLARFLARNGFQVEVLWLAPHEHLRWKKVWRLPDAFDSSLRLRLPSAIRFGRHYFFPGMIWYPFKARALHRVRQLLEKVRLLPPRRPSPHAAAAGTPSRPWMSPPSPAELEIVGRLVRQLRPDVVLASYAWMCPIFKLPELQRSKRACLTHDIGWKRARLAATGGLPPEISREDEAAWLQSAATVIAISESDATDLRALAPAAQVLVAPKACDIPAIASVSSTSASRLLFVGSGNAFNVEGLEWFLREIWPLVRRTTPGCSLDICGSIDRTVSLRPAGVKFHGNVPDLAPFYRDAAVVIVPLLRATGLNIKLIDAAAAGRAIVATSATLDGAPFLRASVLAADAPANFSAAIQHLLTDATANAALAARALHAVQNQLSPTACYGPVAASLRSAA